MFTNILSAIGSANFPKEVIQLFFLANIPSKKSVILATAKITNAITSRSARPLASSITPMVGSIHEYDLMLMVITNVEGRGSRFLYVGKLSHFVRDVVEEFKDQGFVSRKKQIVPRLAQELA